MTQVICPGCAKLIEVGVLPPGTLPSCPYCRTVFQVFAGAHPAESAAPLESPHVAESLQDADASRGETRPREASPRTWRTAAWGLVGVLLAGGILATLLLTAITLLADRDKKKQEPKVQAVGWRVAGEFSGHTHLLTRNFLIESPVWRMTWSCETEQVASKKTFRVNVMDEQGKLVGTPITTHASENGTATMETEPGRYHLSIQATNVRWEVKVEHQP